MRLIDADGLVQKLEEIYDTIIEGIYDTINPRLLGWKSICALILNAIKYCKDEQSQIDPESLKEHARWEKRNCIRNENEQFYKCSNCGRGYSCSEDLGFNYCPNCGAKMDLEGK